MDGEPYQHEPPMEDVDDDTVVPSEDGDEEVQQPYPEQPHQPYSEQLQQPAPVYGDRRPGWQESQYSDPFEYTKGPKPDRKGKAHDFFRILACSFVLLATGVVAGAAGYGASQHKESSTSTQDNRTAVVPAFSASSAWPTAISEPQVFRRADSSQQYLSVKNVTILGPQRSTSVTNLSRDGGSSVLLNGNIVWLYDDTASRNKNGTILSFLSNTAAYSSEPNGSVTLVRDFGVVLANQSNPFQPETAILAKEVVQNGAWIPFTEEEAVINQKDPSQERVAICMCFISPVVQLKSDQPQYTPFRFDQSLLRYSSL